MRVIYCPYCREHAKVVVTTNVAEASPVSESILDGVWIPLKCKCTDCEKEFIAYVKYRMEEIIVRE